MFATWFPIRKQTPPTVSEPEPSTDQLFVPQHPEPQTEADRLMQLLQPQIAKLIDQKTASYQEQIDLLTQQLHSTNARMEDMKQDIEFNHATINQNHSDLAGKIKGRERFLKTLIHDLSDNLDEVRDHLRDTDTESSVASAIAELRVVLGEVQKAFVQQRQENDEVHQRIADLEDSLDVEVGDIRECIENEAQQTAHTIDRLDERISECGEYIDRIFDYAEENDTSFEDLQILVNKHDIELFPHIPPVPLPLEAECEDRVHGIPWISQNTHVEIVEKLLQDEQNGFTL